MLLRVPGPAGSQRRTQLVRLQAVRRNPMKTRPLNITGAGGPASIARCMLKHRYNYMIGRKNIRLVRASALVHTERKEA